MQSLRSFEEATAAFIAVVDDRALTKAASGTFGPEVRLLSIGEKVRRDQAKKRKKVA